MVALYVVGALAIAVASFYAGAKVMQMAGNDVLSAMQARLTDAFEANQRARNRIEHLELTIDEIRARQLDTTAPLAVTPNTPEPEIPAEVERELEQIEDLEGRAEFREQILLLMETKPELEPRQIIAEVFG